MNTEKKYQSYIRNKYELDCFQIKAFDSIDLKQNILVSAPTGSGKTTVADYAIENAKQINPKAKIIYTCPIKALCNEKYRDMVGSWGSNPYNYTIGLMTGDIIINPYGNNNNNENNENFEPEEHSNQITKSNGDIVIMTTEVLQKLLESVNLTNPTNKFNPDVIIFDEAHYIDDDSRGHVWEKCIISSLLYTDALLILLSATIGNIPELTEWLNSICPGKTFIPIIKTIRPVPLRQFTIDNTKSRVFKKITAQNDEDIRKVTSDPDPESYNLNELNGINYDRVKRYWEKLEEFGYSEQFEIETLCNQIKSNPNLGVPAIFFVLSKKKCEQMAQSIGESSYVSKEEKESILDFFDSNLREFKDCIQYIELRKVILKGIGYHHSGLIPKIREVVEFLIKNKLIKIVFATETFAVGLNFPVKTVVITSLVKPTEQGFRFLTVSEYKQMAGRAGRRFLDPYGNVILMLYNPKASVGKKNFYPDWATVSNITDGTVGNIQSKYIVEPNYILKNISTEYYKQMSLKSFKYYRSESKTREFICPDKFLKLFEIDKKIKEFGLKGISYKDKNYSKLYGKLSKSEQDMYKEFLARWNNLSIKTDLELHNDLIQSIVDFLFEYDFIIKSTNTNTNTNTIDKNFEWKLTSKGLLASEFNEINSIIFANHQEQILAKSNLIIPILSMFIDDGIKIRDDELIDWVKVEPEIIYWNNVISQTYSKYINVFPKWTYWPKNYLIVRDWIENPTSTLDQIVLLYETDVGLFVKILIKLYQIIDELISKLDKLNQTDLIEKIVGQKELLIRYPLKIDSLYVNL